MGTDCLPRKWQQDGGTFFQKKVSSSNAKLLLHCPNWDVNSCRPKPNPKWKISHLLQGLGQALGQKPDGFQFFSRLMELWVLWVWGPDLSRATVPHFSCSRCRGPPHTIACFSTPQMAPVMSSTARTSSMVLPAVRATMMFARNCGTVRRGQTGVQMGNHEKDWTPMATTPPNLLFSRNPLDPLHEVQCLHPSGRCLGGG